MERNFSDPSLHKGHPVSLMLGLVADFGPWLPMTLTVDSPSPVVRVLGILAMIVWVIPMLLICSVPIVVLIFGCLFEMAVVGD